MSYSQSFQPKFGGFHFINTSSISPRQMAKYKDAVRSHHVIKKYVDGPFDILITAPNDEKGNQFIQKTLQDCIRQFPDLKLEDVHQFDPRQTMYESEVFPILRKLTSRFKQFQEEIFQAFRLENRQMNQAIRRTQVALLSNPQDLVTFHRENPALCTEAVLTAMKDPLFFNSLFSQPDRTNALFRYMYRELPGISFRLLMENPYLSDSMFAMDPDSPAYKQIIHDAINNTDYWGF